MTTKQKKDKFLEVFEAHLGNISQSCRVIGIDRKTYYNCQVQNGNTPKCKIKVLQKVTQKVS